MVRQEFYNISLNNPGFTVANLPVGAHGYSIAASTGYNFDLGNNWFIEPSAGFIYSRTSVDNFHGAGCLRSQRHRNLRHHPDQRRGQPDRPA